MQATELNVDVQHCPSCADSCHSQPLLLHMQIWLFISVIMHLINFIFMAVFPLLMHTFTTFCVDKFLNPDLNVVIVHTISNYMTCIATSSFFSKTIKRILMVFYISH